MTNKWIFIVGFLFLVCIGGYFFGKWKHRDQIQEMYQRNQLSLFSSDGEFFHTKNLQANDHLLLLITPDELRQEDVLPIRNLYGSLRRQKKSELKIKFVSKVSKDLVRDFLAAAKIQDSFLTDPSGSVRKILKCANERAHFNQWCFVVVDSKLQILWMKETSKVISFDELRLETSEKHAS